MENGGFGGATVLFLRRRAAWLLLAAAAGLALAAPPTLAGPRLPPPPRIPSPEDFRVQNSARELMGTDPELAPLVKKGDLWLVVVDGVVHLNGKVPSKELGERAKEEVGRVKGVKGVSSHLEVVAASQEPLVIPLLWEPPEKVRTAKPESERPVPPARETADDDRVPKPTETPVREVTPPGAQTVQTPLVRPHFPDAAPAEPKTPDVRAVGVQYHVSLLPPVPETDAQGMVPVGPRGTLSDAEARAAAVAGLRGKKPAYAALLIEIDGPRVWVQPRPGTSEQAAAAFAKELRDARLPGVSSVVVVPPARK
jgi:hypothetical protein